MNFVTTQEAWRLIDSYITAKLPTEEVFLGDSLGRILVEDVFAPFDEPAFDKALKDGYAYNSQDLQPEVVAVQRAGEDLGRSYAKGECVKIMTGAVVPKEFDALVPVEDAKIVENRLQITAKVAQNICYQGEYLLKGAKILAKNEKITPQIVGILASVGKKKAQVFRKPKVGVLVTGDELVESFSQLEQGKKFDSNSPMLALQIAELGAEPIEYRVVADTLQETTDAIEKAVRECDLVLSSGGASMGDYDYIPKALENLQAKFEFKKIKFKPGKPTFFATVKGTPYFALPGNPVSSFVVFNLFVTRLIKKMLAQDSQPKSFLLPMGKRFVRSIDLDRQEYRPANIVDGKIEVADFVNSGHLQALAGAQGLVEIPAGQKELPSGSKQRFCWFV